MTLEELQATLPEHLARVGVPKDIRQRLAAPFDGGTPAMLAVRSWLSSSWPMVFLIGGNGCGKTFAACTAIAGHCIDNSARAFIEKTGDLPPWWIWRGAVFMRADEIQALSAGSSEDRATYGQIEATSLLIVDELGIEDGDGERGIGRLLCDRIGDDGRRTIVTTNLSEANLYQRYGNRLRSRLGPAALRVVHGADLRRKAAVVG